MAGLFHDDRTTCPRSEDPLYAVTISGVISAAIDI